jgi:hypothetical protein
MARKYDETEDVTAKVEDSASPKAAEADVDSTITADVTVLDGIGPRLGRGEPFRVMLIAGDRMSSSHVEIELPTVADAIKHHYAKRG